VDFSYPPDAEAFRRELRAWLDEHCTEAHRAVGGGSIGADRDRLEVLRAWNRLVADAGYATISWPKDYGGREASVMEQVVWAEEMDRAGAPALLNPIGLANIAPAIMSWGTEEQKERFLLPMRRGDEIWCQGFSEPDAGSDLASLRTTARRDGDHYVVTGQKIWNTLGNVADWCELLVRTDPNAPKHKGITWLILDMHQPGVEVRPMRTIDGESHFCEVFLTDARVPVADRVGEENDGWRVTNVTLRFERGTAFAQHVITMRSQLRALVTIARCMPAAGGSTWGDPALRAHVGRLEAAVDGLWRMTQQGIAEAEATGTPPASGPAVKIRYSELTQEIADLALRTLGRPALGGAAFRGIEGAEVARDYLWSLQYTIAAGTSQIQRNLIAERILGMPRR